MKIIFVRHGQDAEGFLGGWSQRGLVPEGIGQAERTACYLRENDHQITNILSSDLPRAAETAEIIARELRLSVISDRGLREMNNGCLAGISIAQAAKQYPGLYFNALDMDQQYPGGESPREFYDRVKVWLEDFLKQDHCGNVLVVTHGGVLNIIYHIVKGEPWSNKNRPYRTENCSIHVLNVETMEFETENRTDFLVAQ